MPVDRDRGGRRRILRRVAVLRRECQNLRCHGRSGRGGLGGSVEGMVLSGGLEVVTLQSDTPSGVLRPSGGGAGFPLGSTVLMLG